MPDGNCQASFSHYLIFYIFSYSSYWNKGSSGITITGVVS